MNREQMIELKRNQHRQLQMELFSKQAVMQRSGSATFNQQGVGLNHLASQMSDGSSDSVRYRESLEFIEQRKPGQFPLTMVVDQKLPLFDPLYKKILPPTISQAMETYDISKIKTYFMPKKQLPNAP